jgi:hypothetical protein
MNRDEQIAYNFLIEQGFDSVNYEPNGESTPPDFLIDKNIGVEVRRMNKHIVLNDNKVPIEKTEFEFVPRFRKALKELENTKLKYSIAVTLRYQRPIKVSKELMENIKDSIKATTEKELFGQEIKFSPQIKYELYKGNGKSDETYNLIIISDRDRGGIVQDARYEALKLCIEEKTNKLKSLRNSYDELWLILVDDIFSRVDYTTKQDFQRFPEIKTIFNRVVLISKRDNSKWIDIYPWGIQ